MKHPLAGMEVDVETTPGRRDSEVTGLDVCNVVPMPAGQSQGCTLPFKRFKNEMSRSLQERLDISKQLDVESES